MDFMKQEREKLKELEILLTEKRVSEAETMVRELMVEFPFSFQVKLLCARVYKESDNLEDALSILNGLLAEDSNNISVLNEIGDVCFRMQKYEEAREYYNRLMFLDPFNPNAKAAIDMVERIGQGYPEPEPEVQEKEFDSLSSLKDDFFGTPKVETGGLPETTFFETDSSVSDLEVPPPLPDIPEAEKVENSSNLEDTVFEANMMDYSKEPEEVVEFESNSVSDPAEEVGEFDFQMPEKEEFSIEKPAEEPVKDNYPPEFPEFMETGNSGVEVADVEELEFKPDPQLEVETTAPKDIGEFPQFQDTPKESVVAPKEISFEDFEKIDEPPTFEGIDVPMDREPEKEEEVQEGELLNPFGDDIAAPAPEAHKEEETVEEELVNPFEAELTVSQPEPEQSFEEVSFNEPSDKVENMDTPVFTSLEEVEIKNGSQSSSEGINFEDSVDGHSQDILAEGEEQGSLSFAEIMDEPEKETPEDPFFGETVSEIEEDEIKEAVESEVSVETESDSQMEDTSDIIVSKGYESTDIDFDLKDTPDILYNLHDENVDNIEGEGLPESPVDEVVKDEEIDIEEDDDFGEPEIITESAAILYLKQGLYEDARDVFEKLLLKTGDPKFRLEIEKVGRVKRLNEEVKVLENLLETVKTIGSRSNV